MNPKKIDIYYFYYSIVPGIVYKLENISQAFISSLFADSVNSIFIVSQKKDAQ